MLGRHVPDGQRIFNLAALVVVFSIIVHGVTDTPGATWIAGRQPSASDDQEPPSQ